MSGLKFKLMFGEEGRSWINPQLNQIRPLIHPVRYCEKDCPLVQPERSMQHNNSVAIISATLALASLSVKKKGAHLSVMSGIYLLLRHILCMVLHNSVFLLKFAQT